MHVRLKTLVVLASPFVLLVAAAYLQWGLFGLPALPALAGAPAVLTGGHGYGFPWWLRLTHFVNFFFLVLLVRSGLQILADHPRLYWNLHCTPGSEWLGFTPVRVPVDRVWTAKQDSRHLSPIVGLPGYRHTVGMARHWHFLSVLFWLANGFIYVALLFLTDHWRRLVPTSWSIFPEAWAYFVHYATLHLPPEPNGFFHYNALQQLSYFGVVFVLAPLAMVTGPSMSPAFTARFRWYPKLPGNRQVGRSIHFLIMCAFVAFVLMHVAMVLLTGARVNLNHIVRGTNDANPLGLIVGVIALAGVVAANVLANWLAWRHPRRVQHASKLLVNPVMGFLLDRTAAQAQFERKDISPYFWVNGNMPDSELWRGLAANQFRDYRLRVTGLVENPLELSLRDLAELGKKTQVTLHHCIQGWSGIAAWSGIPVSQVLALARPKAGARAVIFHSFGNGVDFTTGEVEGEYYDSLSLVDATRPLTLLAYEMNDQPLSDLHGAPLRLRVENQLGFKMVKWLRSIELVEDVRSVGKGEGGYAEDNEYFGARANI